MDMAPSLPVIEHQRAQFAEGLLLDCGQRLDEFALAYRTAAR